MEFPRSSADGIICCDALVSKPRPDNPLSNEFLLVIRLGTGTTRASAELMK
jgi:hypothetical protein